MIHEPDCVHERPVLGERSPRWPGVRDAFRAAHPDCAVCGSRAVDIHHVVPFHVRPDLELEPENLLSLCPEHHLLFGHLMAWRSWNPGAKRDANYWRAKIMGRFLEEEVATKEAFAMDESMIPEALLADLKAVSAAGPAITAAMPAKLAVLLSSILRLVGPMLLTWLQEWIDSQAPKTVH